MMLDPDDDLATFQLYFRGTFQADVGTANNNVDGAPSVVDPVRACLAPALAIRTDAEARELLYPAAGRAPTHWNPFGTGAFTVDAEVCGGEWFDGEWRELGEDLLRGAQVRVDGHGATRAVMVDADPTGLDTQVFAARWTLTGKDWRVVAANPTRAFSSAYNLHRAVNDHDGGIAAASAVFRSGIRPGDLVIPEIPSPALDRLRALRDAGWGIAIQYCLYGTRPAPRDGRALVDTIRAGGKPHNPRSGSLVGVIQAWDPSRPASYPMGRPLMPLVIKQEPDRADLGPAWVHVDERRGRVTVDLQSTVPEVGTTGRKVDVGGLRLEAKVGGVWTSVGVVSGESCGETAYRARAGFADVVLAPGVALDCLRAARIRLQAERDEVTVGGRRIEVRGNRLREREWCVRTDRRALQFDLGSEEPWHVVAEVEVSRWGQPERDAPLVIQADPEVSVAFTGPALTDARGTARLVVRPLSACAGRLFAVHVEEDDGADRDPTRGARFAVGGWCDVRVLPVEDAPVELTWGSVYSWILRYFALIHPAMSQRIDLSSEAAVRAYAGEIGARVAPGAVPFEDTRFMPITRDLPLCRRRALLRWLEAPVPPPAPPPASVLVK